MTYIHQKTLSPSADVSTRSKWSRRSWRCRRWAAPPRAPCVKSTWRPNPRDRPCRAMSGRCGRAKPRSWSYFNANSRILLKHLEGQPLMATGLGRTIDIIDPFWMGIFHYQASILGIPHVWKPPHEKLVVPWSTSLPNGQWKIRYLLQWRYCTI